MSSQQLLGCCDCPADEQCPIPPCPDCTPDVAVVTLMASGTCSRDGFSYDWVLTAGALQPTARYREGPGSTVNTCGWEWRSGNLSLTLTGNGPLAGTESLGRDDDAAVLLCLPQGVGQPLLSRVRIRGLQSFGQDRFIADCSGTGTYVPCAIGFSVAVIDDVSGISIAPASGGPLSSQLDALSVVFS